MPTKKLATKNSLPAMAITETPENFKQYLTEFESQLPEDENLLWEGARQCVNAEILSFIHAGQYFLKIKEQCGHGEFIKAREEQGFNSSFVDDRIRIATRFTQLDIPNSRLGGNLGISKIRQLVKWDDIQIIDFFQGKEVYGMTIDQAQELTKLDFERQIKENKDETKALIEENKSLKIELEFAREDLNDLHNELEDKNRLGRWDDLTTLIRDEAVAVSDNIAISLDDLSRVVQKTISDADKLDTDNLNACLNPLMHNLKFFHSQTQSLLTQLTDKFACAVDATDINKLEQLDDHEIKRLQANRDLFMNVNGQQRLLRAQKREEKKIKGKGRPVSDKNLEMI